MKKRDILPPGTVSPVVLRIANEPGGRRASASALGMDRQIILSLGLGLAFVVLGLFLRSGEIVALAVPLVLYASLHTASTITVRRPNVSIERTVERHRVTEDDLVSVTILVTNHGVGLRLLSVLDEIPDGVTLVEGKDEFTGPLRAKASESMTYVIRARRGEHRFAVARIRLWSPWGLGKREWHTHSETTLLVYPRVVPLEPIVIRPPRTRAFAGPVKANLGGRGLDFFGCRAFTPGDDIRRINWRAFARHDNLIINEYELERIADVNVILDARARSHTQVGASSTFDHAVRAAASLAEHFIDQGNNVGLLIYGDYLNWVFPSMGKSQKERILAKLSRAQMAEKVAFEDLRNIPARLFPARSQLVLVSPLVVEDDLEVVSLLIERGYCVLLVSPRATSVELATFPAGDPAAALAERITQLKRALFVESLSRVGARVVDWDVGEPLESATRRTPRPGIRRYK